MVWNAPGLSSLQRGPAMAPEGLLQEQGCGINYHSTHDEENASTQLPCAYLPLFMSSCWRLQTIEPKTTHSNLESMEAPPTGSPTVFLQPRLLSHANTRKSSLSRV
jgi:hypothetical protein